MSVVENNKALVSKILEAHNLVKVIKNHELLQTHLFINGQFIKSDLLINVNSPINNTLITKVMQANQEHINYAIDCANTAFGIWKNYTAKERSLILKYWSQLVLDNQDDLAIIITAESGKVIADALSEIKLTASYIEWYSEEAKRCYGEIIDSNVPNQQLLVTKSPVGVCAIITPWNFPASMIARKAVAAIAVGATVVIKPSSHTPLIALALGYLAQKAGVLAGVINILPSNNDDFMKVVSQSRIVRKLSFTGSTAVGTALYANSAPTLKRISLELGGNAPFVVLDDAIIEDAVAGLIRGKLRSTGQACIAPNRILVAKPIYANFMQQLTLAIKQVKLGNPFDLNTQVGAIISRDAVNKMLALIKDAVDHGAELICGGTTASDIGENFLLPTILGNCTPEMQIFSEEIFGPILAIYTFVDDTDAVKMANNTQYGLACYLYGSDINRLHNVGKQLECGILGINTGIVTTENAPFGGVKCSGFGSEGGKYGVEEYLTLKYQCYQYK